jgi:PTS system nitrogen regulatory IIA component
MALSVRDSARLFAVSERTIHRWIAERGLPAHRVRDHFRLQRAEVLEWATIHRVPVSPELFTPREQDLPLPMLEAALRSGGIVHDLAGRDRNEVLRSVVAVLQIPADVDREFIFEVLRAREQLASTAIGSGIALPHPRHPLLLHVEQPSVTLCFLKDPVEYGALDGEPVFALFAILSPTARAHLHLLGLLAFALQQPEFRSLVERRGSPAEILKAAAEAEARCRGASERAPQPRAEP